MSEDRRPSRRRSRRRRPAAATPAPPTEARPAAPPTASERGRRWPGAGSWLVLLLGVWVGRVLTALPEGLQPAAGVLLAVLTALLAAVVYRRWARRALADARTRRAARRR